MVEDKVKVLIISEDRGKDSFAVFKNLISSILKNIIPDFQSQLIEYIEIDAKHSGVLSGNKWRQRRPRDRKLTAMIHNFKRELIQYLLEGPAFIFWHIDGDMRWCDFTQKGNCTNLEQLNSFLAPIESELESYRSNSSTKLPKNKVLKLLPFYSIEAWLYQNSTTLQNIKGDTSDIHAKSPSDFDEILKVKDSFNIKDEYNLQLSKSFPFQKVYALGKSFHRTVEELKDASGFLDTVEEKQNEQLLQWN